jgi:hypothetical protein
MSTTEKTTTTTYAIGLADSRPFAVVEVKMSAWLKRSDVTIVHATPHYLPSVIAGGRSRDPQPGDTFFSDYRVAAADAPEAIRRVLSQEAPARWRQVTEWWDGTRMIAAPIVERESWSAA